MSKGKSSRNSKATRFLGLYLSGARNLKTVLTVIDEYPEQGKVFLTEIHEKIGTGDEEDHDRDLLRLLEKYLNSTSRIAVNMPLQLPPCFTCNQATCRRLGKCSDPAVKWASLFVKKVSTKNERAKFTPYTQRPVDVWVRYHVLNKLSNRYRFEVDETMGGTRGPLSARMMFLKRFLGDAPFVEVWPKLTVASLAERLKLNYRYFQSYRSMEEGAHARLRILEEIAEEFGVFIYSHDQKKLRTNLAAFDSFICALTAWFESQGKTTTPAKGFPLASGWVSFPKLL